MNHSAQDERDAIVAWLVEQADWEKAYAADPIYQLKYRADAQEKAKYLDGFIEAIQAGQHMKGRDT